jgi:nickel-dependent lactate racemase
VTSAAGYPLDKTYYQTVKAMVAPLAVMEPGGTLVVASECSEGMGSAEYVRAQERLVALGPEAFLRQIAPKRLADVDEWETQMQVKAMRVARIQLFSSGLDPRDRARTGVEVVESVEDAVLASVARTGDPAVAVIPEGPYVVPFVA